MTRRGIVAATLFAAVASAQQNVQQAPGQTFQKNVIFSVNNPYPSGYVVAFLTVPVGKQLVIETVTFHGVATKTEPLHSLKLQTYVSPNHAAHEVVTTKRSFSATQDIYSAAQSTRIYADPGTGVTIWVLGDLSSGQLAVSGYLVDKP
jgi:hypothetical protein